MLIHSDGNDLDIIRRGEAFGQLARRRAAGDIRLIGMSPKTPEGTRAAMDEADVLMVTLNDEDTSHLEIINEAHAAGCGILVKKALASGHAEPGRALGYVLSESAVDSAVVGTISEKHLLDNVAVADALRR